MHTGGEQSFDKALALVAGLMADLEQGYAGGHRAALNGRLHELANCLTHGAREVPPAVRDHLGKTLRGCNLALFGQDWRAEVLERLHILGNTLREARGLVEARGHAAPVNATAHQIHAAANAEARPPRLGVVARRGCRPGDELIARFAAFPPGMEAEMTELLLGRIVRSRTHLTPGESIWKTGTRVEVGLTAKGLSIVPPVQNFIWRGERVLLDFVVLVPDHATEGKVDLHFEVAIHGVTLACLHLAIQIGAQRDAGQLRAVEVDAARRAFVSHAADDRLRVLERLAPLREAAGMDLFVDGMSADPGGHRQDRLIEEIRERDLFLLFWSRPAARSQWVEWEWRRALAEGRQADMEIHHLDDGVVPPPELSGLRVGDGAMAVRAAGGGNAMTDPMTGGETLPHG